MAKDQQPKKVEGARSFAHFIGTLCDGDANLIISEEKHELGQALMRSARARNATAKGELTLKIKFAADPSGFVETTFEVKSKLPPKSTPKGVVFLTEQGNFTHQNPRQPDLPGIREVPAPRAARAIDDDDLDEDEVREVP